MPYLVEIPKFAHIGYYDQAVGGREGMTQFKVGDILVPKNKHDGPHNPTKEPLRVTRAFISNNDEMVEFDTRGGWFSWRFKLAELATEGGAQEYEDVLAGQAILEGIEREK